MGGDSREGHSESRFAIGIHHDASSADREPTAREIRRESERSISLDQVWKKKATPVEPLQSVLEVPTRDGDGADRINYRHALPVQSPDQFVPTAGESSPPLGGVAHEIDVPEIRNPRVARPVDLHVQRGAQLATQTSKSGTKTEIEIEADKISDDAHVHHVAESGRASGRAELLAKKGGTWAHAASAGTGTDP